MAEERRPSSLAAARGEIIGEVRRDASRYSLPSPEWHVEETERLLWIERIGALFICSFVLERDVGFDRPVESALETNLEIVELSNLDPKASPLWCILFLAVVPSQLSCFCECSSSQH